MAEASQHDKDLGDDALSRLAGTLAEDAAVSGLCRDGQIEIAAGRIRLARPGWSDEAVLAFAAMAVDER